MFSSRVALLPRKPWVELDYARHMPKEYVERVKRTVPKKVFDGRFGAPPVVRWTVAPDDYVPSMTRPWENEEFNKNLKREQTYHSKMVNNKWFHKRINPIERIPDEKWTFFTGDQVQVMVGKDKGKQATVTRVARDTNEVLVDQLHTKLVDEAEQQAKENKQEMTKLKMLKWVEQPLRVDRNEVKLVDPRDNEPCDAKWVLSNTGSEYVRISVRSGTVIPIPSQAYITYEYASPQTYIDCSEKDTPPEHVFERTYQPRLASFEEEIMDELGIEEHRKPKPTYWY